MGSGFSDNYSFLGNSDAVASHNFNFIGEADDTPPITGIKTNSENRGEFPTQNNQSNQSNRSSQGYNQDYNQDNMTTYNPNMGNQGNSMAYDPEIFSDPAYNSNSDSRSKKSEELDQKYEALMRRRDIGDSMANLY